MGKGGYTERMSQPKPQDGDVVPEGLLSGSDYNATKLSDTDAWIENLDHEAFKADIYALGRKLAASQGPEDVAHLEKIVWWSRLCQWIGVLTMWHSVNIVSIFFLSLGCMTRWTIVGHHVCHGGFDRHKHPRYNRFKFGVGSLMTRATDWLDWMLVEAWNVEHNMLHHYHLGEDNDPDLVERNLDWVRVFDSTPVKYLVTAIMVFTWKWYYYAPNTFKELKIREARRDGKDPSKGGKYDLKAPCVISPTWLKWGGSKWYTNAEFFGTVLGPFFVQRFILLPLPVLLLLGTQAYKTALINLVLGEVFTNMHSFIVIATNHAGDDLYRFESHCKPRSATFYLRQVVSSVNFSMGNDYCDFLHGWLNYQVEHHLWPDLSMLQYQRSAPLVQAICEKHGVPYLKHNVFYRFKKTVDIMVGNSSMRKFPAKWENAADITEVTH